MQVSHDMKWGIVHLPYMEATLMAKVILFFFTEHNQTLIFALAYLGRLRPIYCVLRYVLEVGSVPADTWHCVGAPIGT